MEEEKHIQVDERKWERIKMALAETEVYLYPENDKQKAKTVPDRRKSFGLSLASILKEDYLGEFQDVKDFGENQGKLL
jgi:hypothetical protein